MVGDFSSDLDEGLKNIAHYCADELSKNNEVKRLNIKRPRSFEFLYTFVTFKPDVIHYFTGPTLQSLFLLKILGMRARRSKRIVSALLPKSSEKLFHNKTFITLHPYLKPDLVIVQNKTIGMSFESIRYPIKYLYNGVDIEKFKPVDHELKMSLREKYGIDKNKFIVLHVGHLSRVRNIQSLMDLQSNEVQVLIVGSTYLGVDNDLCDSLEKKGCKVIKGYVSKVNELYQLSDCYIFPVDPGNSICMPLSVLEAMACNIPVITTKYEGLTDAFSQGNGLYFEENVKNFNGIIDRIRLQKGIINTRDMVKNFSWGSIVSDLEKCYNTI